MHGIKIPLQDFALKMRGGGYVQGGAYSRDTTVYTVHVETFLRDLIL